MRAEIFLPVLLSVVMTMAFFPDVQAKEAIKKPDLDLLEYLGTFEAERGKEIDPLPWIACRSETSSIKPSQRRGKQKK
jgi:hypothetical protein